MKSSALLVSLFLAAGCGGDDDSGVGTAAACAGNYAGAYSGSVSGVVTATLATDGTIQATFLQSGSSTGPSGATTLQSDGTISLVIAGNQITGRLDAACHATGNWIYPGVGQGNWQMQKQ
jgi:hypothetical protein